MPLSNYTIYVIQISDDIVTAEDIDVVMKDGLGLRYALMGNSIALLQI